MEKYIIQRFKKLMYKFIYMWKLKFWKIIFSKLNLSAIYMIEDKMKKLEDDYETICYNMNDLSDTKTDIF